MLINAQNAAIIPRGNERLEVRPRLRQVADAPKPLWRRRGYGGRASRGPVLRSSKSEGGRRGRETRTRATLRASGLSAWTGGDDPCGARGARRPRRHADGLRQVARLP